MPIAYNIVSPDFIESTRIAVCQPTMQDVDCLFRIYGDPRTNMFNPAGPMRSPADASDTMARWLSGWAEFGFGAWAVSLTGESNQVVDFGGLYNHDASRRVLEKAGLTEYGLLDDVPGAPPSIVYRVAR
jgi:ribosomal-protein-alanine N-acetyltransferase